MLQSLRVSLPPGRLVAGEDGDDDRPVMWISDGAVPDRLWAELRSAHATSGLWPLLLDPLDDDEDRPWGNGEFGPAGAADPAACDAAEVLAGIWADNTGGDDHDLAPYARGWPGLAPPVRIAEGEAERVADAVAVTRMRWLPARRLGLVPVARSADAVATIGWRGAINYLEDAAGLSAVLRSWEDRFGIRVIGAGFAELHLSVPAPPTSVAAALPIAAEHFALCPDTVHQGAGTLRAWANQLVGSPLWSFWWD